MNGWRMTGVSLLLAALMLPVLVAAISGGISPTAGQPSPPSADLDLTHATGLVLDARPLEDHPRLPWLGDAIHRPAALAHPHPPRPARPDWTLTGSWRQAAPGEPIRIEVLAAPTTAAAAPGSHQGTRGLTVAVGIVRTAAPPESGHAPSPPEQLAAGIITLDHAATPPFRAGISLIVPEKAFDAGAPGIRIIGRLRGRAPGGEQAADKTLAEQTLPREVSTLGD